MKPRNYQGTHDYLSRDAYVREAVSLQIIKAFKTFGFEPLETPIIELWETLTGKTGGETASQIFKLERGEDLLGLRFDQTVPLARVLSQYANTLLPRLPYRRYTSGPVFRAERPQAGRYRQFTQLDADIVGVAGAQADAEIISLCWLILKNFGIKEFVIELNDRRILNELADSVNLLENEAVAWLRILDKLDKKGLDELIGEMAAALPAEKLEKVINLTKKMVGLSKKSNKAIISGLRSLAPGVGKGVADIEQILDLLKQFKVPTNKILLNPLLARGLDYYTGPVWEMVVKEGGVGSLGGGGRYDKLISTLGGPDLPATGVSFGLERVVFVLDQLGLLSRYTAASSVFVTVFRSDDTSSVKISAGILAKLRSWGISSEIYVGNDSLGKQLQLADRKGIPLAIICGPDELARGSVLVKDLTIPFTGEKDKSLNQEAVPLNLLRGYLKRVLSV